MDWCMNHQDTYVRSVQKESTNTQDQTICKGILPQSIDIMTKTEADFSLVDTFA